MTWLQDWLDVLFLHFPVSPGQVQPLLPKGVECDTFEGRAWISYVFFRLRLRPAWLPFVPGFSSLLELNVRTYVRHQGNPGICFLRMYADNRLAIRAARLLTPLCYELATMVDEGQPDGGRHIECRPAQPGAGVLLIDYSVSGAPVVASPGTLDEWLLERYRLFVGQRDGGVLTAQVEHPPWKAAAVDCRLNWDGGPARAALACPTLLHHSPGVTARFKAFLQGRATHSASSGRYAFAGSDGAG